MRLCVFATHDDSNLSKYSYPNAIKCLIEDHKDGSSLTFILENLGRLSKDFDGSFLSELLTHKNASVPLWIVKTFGKVNKKEYLSTLKKTALNDMNTTVRREAVSSIGRMRNIKGKEILFEILKDEDPKIVSQAIRGLLIFKGEFSVDRHVKNLINHENEMVRTIIYKEYFAKVKDKYSQLHTESPDYLKNTI